MTALKERAFKIIEQMPDDQMELTVVMLEALSSYKKSDKPAVKSSMRKFFEAAGKIDIDGEAVKNLREESMI